MTRAHAAPRLALVELRATDPFSQYRTELFPFLAGLADDRGVPWRWVSLGFDREAQPIGPFVVTLSDDDLDALADALARHRASHVVCNERLAPDTREALDARVAEAGLETSPTWRTMGEDDSSGPWTFGEHTGALASWLGLEPGVGGDGLVVDRVSPRYEQEAIGRLDPPALVTIIGGTNCLYQRPIARVPELAHLADVPHHARFGCTFCGSRTTAGYPYEADAVALAQRQLRAAEATWRAPERPRSYLLNGIRAVLRVDEVLVPLMGDLRGPRHFHVSLRANELRARRAPLERAIAACARGGHRLHLSNMGVENFSPAENARFNKGLGADDVFGALDLIRGWNRRYPGALAFDEDGGFGFILFTPWTTLDDLEINAEAISRLPPSTHTFLLTTRLLLQPERAITTLAQADGAVSATWPDPVHGRFSRAGCLNSADDVELPWRFLHHEADLLCRIMMRAEPQAAAHVDPGDADLRAVREALAPWGPSPALLPLFRAALEALRGPRPPATVAALVASAAALMPQPRADVRAGDPGWIHDLSTLARLLEVHPRRPLGPLQVHSLSCDDRGTAHLRLEGAGEAVELLIAPRRANPGPWLAVAGDFALSHRGETPLATRATRRAFRAVARALAAANRAGRVRPRVPR